MNILFKIIIVMFLLFMTNIVYSNDKNHEFNINIKQKLINNIYDLNEQNNNNLALKKIDEYLEKNNDDEILIFKLILLLEEGNNINSNLILEELKNRKNIKTKFIYAVINKLSPNEVIELFSDGVLLNNNFTKNEAEVAGFLGINYLKINDYNNTNKYLKIAYDLSNNEKFNKLLILNNIKNNNYIITPLQKEILSEE